MKRYGKSFLESIYEQINETCGIDWEAMADDFEIPPIFEMKKRKGVWTYEPKRGHIYFGGADFAGTSADYTFVNGVQFDECEPVDWPRIEAVLSGRQFSGSSPGARIPRVPTRPTVEIRGTGYLRRSLEEHRGTLRAALDEALRKAML